MRDFFDYIWIIYNFEKNVSLYSVQNIKEKYVKVAYSEMNKLCYMHFDWIEGIVQVKEKIHSEWKKSTIIKMYGNKDEQWNKKKQLTEIKAFYLKIIIRNHPKNI